MAGSTFAVMKNIGYWAPLGTPIPGRHVPHGGAWPAGWVKITDTVNGWQVVSRNPRVAVPSEERGRIGQVAGGDEGVSVATQFRSLDMDLYAKISAWEKKSKAASTEVASLTITTGASALGTVLVTLNGLTTTVTLTGTAPLTADQVATQIRAAAFTGYTTGGTGATVTFTATTTGDKSGANSFATGTAAGVAGTMTTPTEGAGATEIFALDKDVPMGMMLGVEGLATAGSFFNNRRWIRFIAYNAENTGNPEFPFRSTGLDAVISPSASFECLAYPDVLPAAMLAGTDFTAADLDKNRRANWFAIDAPTV